MTPTELVSPELRARLQTLGFVEAASAAPTTAPRSRAFASHPKRGISNNKLPQRAKTAPASTRETPIAPSSTQRAETLISALARDENERRELSRVLPELIEELAEAAEPMRALLNFSRLCDAIPDRSDFFYELEHDAVFLARLCRLLSFSQALSDSLIRDPQQLQLVRDGAKSVSRSQLRHAARAAMENATRRDANADIERAQIEALRAFRRRETLRIGLLDMESATWRDEENFNVVVRQISDLAQVCVAQTLRVLATSRGLCDAPFCVFGMGKLGARELNYSSDIDLIFIHDGEDAAMQNLGESLLKALGDAGENGALFRVDMRLRPDGTSGPLATPFGYALSYYESYAAAWEWQAMIKIRGLAGDARLARRFRKFVRGVTWAKRSDDAHLREMLAMKRRMETRAEGLDSANVKQGPGSIRDAEWVVQQLQMMVGPSHPKARVPNMLRALRALTDLQSLTHDEADRLREGYLFLRVLEHRLQLWQEQPIRNIPAGENERAALARRVGISARGAVAARQLDEEHARHRRDVRALCERVFWAWQEEHPDEGEMPREYSQLSEEARQRLARIAEGTQTQPLPAPLSRQIRAALPDALQHLSHAADEERALRNLENLCDASGNRLSLLRTLGAGGELSRAVFSILGGSQRLSDTLFHFPQLLDMAAQRPLLARPRTPEEARGACRDYCLMFRDRRAALRRWRDREILRIGLRDLVMNAPPQEIAREIADLAAACLGFACDEVRASRRPRSEDVAFFVIGMGKLSGGEMHYASDADVMFGAQNLLASTRAGTNGGDVNRESENLALSEATAQAEEVMRFCGERTEDGIAFEVDARLRPDGERAPLVRSVEGFLEYFEREIGGIAVWERQALTRARIVAGDSSAAARLMAAIRHVAFPDAWRASWGDELRHIKGRVENERAAKGARSGEVFDVKLGTGTLSDIEFCAQWLAMKHGAKVFALQTPNTLAQIEAAKNANLLSDEEAAVLRETYLFLRRAELRLQITQERAVKAVKRDSKEYVAWARAVFPDDPNAAEHFSETWDASTRAARRVMERVRDEL